MKDTTSKYNFRKYVKYHKTVQQMKDTTSKYNFRKYNGYEARTEL